MGRHFSLLLLGVDKQKAGLFGVLQDAGLIDTHCHGELRGAWNHIATTEPADLVIVSLASSGRQGCPIGLADVMQHLGTRWPDVPVLAVRTGAAGGQAARALPGDAIRAEVADSVQLASLVEQHLKQVLDRHIQALNTQHTEIARAFRQLQQNCSLDRRRDRSRQILGMLEGHFRFEERFMAAHGYERLQAHADGHACLLERASAAIDACRQGDVEATARSWQAVRAEMDTHIRDDQTYLGFLEEMRQGLSAQLRRLAATG